MPEGQQLIKGKKAFIQDNRGEEPFFSFFFSSKRRLFAT
jgi:hypothetical protein